MGAGLMSCACVCMCLGWFWGGGGKDSKSAIETREGTRTLAGGEP